jgi:hypothetical protein
LTIRKISYIIDLVKLRYDFVYRRYCEYTCQRDILGLKLSKKLEAHPWKIFGTRKSDYGEYVDGQLHKIRNNFQG